MSSAQPSERPQTERRRAPRVRTEEPIPVRILAPGRLADGVLYDLNNAGAFVATGLALERGTRIHLELRLPGIDDPPPLQAVVARCSPAVEGRRRSIPAGIGVAFVAETLQQRELIQQMVMATLTLDLLGRGCEKGDEPSTSDTLPAGEKHLRD